MPWCLAISAFACLTHFLGTVSSQGLYSVIAPDTLRPNADYHVAVSVFENNDPVVMRIALRGANYTDVQLATVYPYITELVYFKVPELKRDRYSLTVEGISGLVFSNETVLNYDAQQFTVLVQTDKAIYKPGDVVRYRALLLDRNLKPATSYDSVRILLKDAADNVIRSTDNAAFSNGVHSGELQLADLPQLGQWSIYVEAGDERHRGTFEVLEYILPKFIVAVETKKHAIYTGGRLPVTVKANYPFGRPVVGEVTLSIYPTFFGSLQPFVNDLITRRVMPINGAAVFDFDIKAELRLKEDYEREYLLDAFVEERSTGLSQNYSTVVIVHLDQYRVDTVRMPAYYIPGVPFEVIVRVVNNAEDTAKDPRPGSLLTAYLTDSNASDDQHNQTGYALNGAAIVKMAFTVPANDTRAYRSVLVDYMGIVTDCGRIPRKRLHAKNFIVARVADEEPLANQDVTLIVQCSRPMDFFIYQILGRGNILLSRTVKVPGATVHTIKFFATFAMVPHAKLLVYTTMDGELIYDELMITFSENFTHNVHIEAPSRVLPGQDVNISVSTAPFSYVALMVVDQKALNIKAGNDLSPRALRDALTRFQLGGGASSSAGQREVRVVTMSNVDFAIAGDPEQMQSHGSDLTIIRKTDIGPAHEFEVNTRAPGTGPYAFSYTPKPFWHNPRIHVMHDPSDTWLFLNANSGEAGRTTIRQRLPNAATSWIVSAFAVDSHAGLELSGPVHVMPAYKDLHIAVDLPYSIRMGEMIALPFVVFNSKDTDVDADITLYNTANEFQFVQLGTTGTNSSSKVELYSRRALRLPAKSSMMASFVVTPRRVGAITVKAVANNQRSSDSVESTLLVEYPGAVDAFHRTFLFDLNARSHVKENVTIAIPHNIVADSARVQVRVMGNILAPLLSNMDNLIAIPTGCGEQAMIHFMPNIIALQHLQDVGKFEPDVEKRAKAALNVGYQRVLYYRHSNGGFSAFGLADNKSSTWLTAYVSRGLRQASRFVQVEEGVIRTALEYVIAMQEDNGSFREQPGTFNVHEVALTSFVALTLLENMPFYSQHKPSLQRAIDFIASGSVRTDNVHAVAIGAYVLSLVDHSAKGEVLQKLMAMSRGAGDRKWWSKTVPISEFNSPWYNRTRTVDVETSSYAALALLQNNMLADATPVLTWLLDQRNEFGGFAASQDTVVALQALREFAKRLPRQLNNVQVAFYYGQGVETVMNVDEDNSLAVLSHELPNTIKNITVTATGGGMVLAQVSYQYHTNVTSAWPRFVLDPTVNKNSHSDYLHLSACTSFVPARGGATRSNMAVMEIYLPSGFVVDTDTLPTLESSKRIMKVETKQRNSVVVIYFDYVDRQEVCPTLHAYKTIKVTNHKPVPIIMYDYYDNARRARMFYQAPKSSICDIYEDGNRDTFCERAEKRKSSPSSASASQTTWRLPSGQVLGAILLSWLLLSGH